MCSICRKYSDVEVVALLNLVDDYELEGREVCSFYTIDEICKTYNGVGPDRFPERVREVLTKLNRIALPAVLVHDLWYDHGGSREDFHRVNRQLLHNLRKIAKEEYRWYNPMRWIQWVRSWIAYKICEDIGFEGFVVRI